MFIWVGLIFSARQFYYDSHGYLAIGENYPYEPIYKGKPGTTVKSCIIAYMIELNIPGEGILRLEHLVTDVNGTVAVDGQLLEGASRSLRNLRDRLEIHLITADTHGRQTTIDQQLGMTAVRISPGNEAEQKAAYVHNLGAAGVVAIGQGANDAAMLKAAGLGICVLSKEGTAVEALLSADLLASDIYAALELLEKPLRIVASLRK